MKALPQEFAERMKKLLGNEFENYEKALKWKKIVEKYRPEQQRTLEVQLAEAFPDKK